MEQELAKAAQAQESAALARAAREPALAVDKALTAASPPNLALQIRAPAELSSADLTSREAALLELSAVPAEAWEQAWEPV